MKPADPPCDEDDQHRLDELLDQTDFEVAEETAAHQVILQQGCRQHADGRGNDERAEDPSRRQRRARVMVQVPHDRRHRDQEAAQQDDGGQQDQIAGEVGRPD